MLGDLEEIRLTASKFFEQIQSWMPFISKKRFYEIYLRPSFQSKPDVALLLISLKLITTLPSSNSWNPRTALYHAVKHFYLEAEGFSIFSIQILQAGVIICIYELGHAIYPAAFLSIGACARYAHALGINAGTTFNTRRVLTLIEVEERRRVWWAIIILDRFVLSFFHCLRTILAPTIYIEYWSLLKLHKYRLPGQTLCNSRSQARWSFAVRWCSMGSRCMSQSF